MRNRRPIHYTGLALIALLAFAIPARASSIILDFDDAAATLLETEPYLEDGVIFTVLAGHYDIGDAGVFNIDDHTGTPTIMVTLANGGAFSVDSLDVIRFTEFNYITSNLGGMFVPTAIGHIGFSDSFIGITALFLTQTRITDFYERTIQHNFAIDNLTVAPVPESSAWALLLVTLCVFIAMLIRSGSARRRES